MGLVDQLIHEMDKVKEGLIFVNLVDFDTHYGHRRDVPGYALALEEFDKRIPEIESKLIDDDLVLITACLLYTSPSPRDRQKSRMPSSA